jgi:hypothetical protein
MVNASIFQNIRSKISRISLILVFSFVSILQVLLFTFQVHATAATGYVRLDRMATSATGTASTGATICMTPQTTGTVAKVLISFPGNGTAGAASFGLSSTAANYTLGTSNIPAGSSAWPGIGSNPSSVATNVITVASSTLTLGTQYCFNFVGATTITNPSSTGTNLTGTIQTQTAGSAPIDTINWATAIISNDQIAVTASVPSTFSFSLSGNTATLGTLTTSGATSASAITASVSTNANNGFLSWVKSANAGLNSPSSGGTLPSASFVATGGNIVDMASTSGYVLDVQNTSSSTITAYYAGNGSTSGGNLSTNYQQTASSAAPVNNAQFTLAVRARAAATTKAATDYADTLTVSASGQF